MTNKIRRKLAKNYIEQAKKNRIKAWVLTVITALCTIPLFYAGINEKRLIYPIFLYLGSMAMIFISMIYTIIAWVKTKPENLAKSKEVLDIVKRIFEHNGETLLHAIGKALTGEAKDPGFLCTVTTEMPNPNALQYYPKMTYNLHENNHSNAYFINELYIELRDNDFRIICKIGYKTESKGEGAASTTINVEKNIDCFIPLLEQHLPADLKELATM